MRIHVADLLGVDAARLQGMAHRPHCSLAFRLRGGEVVHVGARAVTRDFGEDAGATRLRVVHVLEQEHHRSLAHDEAVAPEVERTARLLRFIVALAGRLDLAERAHRERRDGRLRPAREHRLGVAALDDLRSLADAVSARSARADDGVVGAAGLAVDGDDAGRHVGDHPALHQRGVALLDLLHSADARADDHADVVRVHLRRVQTAVGKRLLGRREGELAVAADVASRLAVHVVLGVEALDLGRDLGVEVGGVEARDPAHPRHAFDHVRPDGLHVVADRCDEAHAGDSHASPVGFRLLRHKNSIRTRGRIGTLLRWQKGPLSLDTGSKGDL